MPGQGGIIERQETPKHSRGHQEQAEALDDRYLANGGLQETTGHEEVEYGGGGQEMIEI